MKHDKITHGNLWKQMSLYRTDWMEIKFKSPSPTKHLGSLLFYNSISLSDDDGQHPFHLPLGLLERDVQVLVVLDHHLGESADHFYVEKMASLTMDCYHSIV